MIASIDPIQFTLLQKYKYYIQLTYIWERAVSRLRKWNLIETFDKNGERNERQSGRLNKMSKIEETF